MILQGMHLRHQDKTGDVISDKLKYVLPDIVYNLTVFNNIINNFTTHSWFIELSARIRGTKAHTKQFVKL